MVISLWQYFLFLIIALFLGLRAAAATDECKVSRCGEHGPPIWFPFRLKTIPPEHCRYPGFELSCNKRKQTVLKLPVLVEMVVKEIDYITWEIHTYDPEHCLIKQLPSLNLSASPFSFNSTGCPDLVLFNCSPPKRDALYSIPCLSVEENHVYGTFNTWSIYDLRFCIKIRNISSVPVDFFASDHQNKLVLNWKKPKCRECEEQGRICSWKNYNTTVQPPEFECLHVQQTTTGILVYIPTFTLTLITKSY